MCWSVWAGLSSLDGDGKAGERTFQAEGTTYTKVCSVWRMGPEVFTFGAFKILNIPLLGKYLIKLSAGVEIGDLESPGPVDRQEQD